MHGVQFFVGVLFFLAFVFLALGVAGLHKALVNGRPKVCDCGDEEGELEDCPYAAEIGGVSEPCTCCDGCRYQCAMDI